MFSGNNKYTLFFSPENYYNVYTTCTCYSTMQNKTESNRNIRVCNVADFFYRTCPYPFVPISIPLSNRLSKIEPGHEKMCLKSYAKNKGVDQPAHPRSLISAFVVRGLDSIISLDSIAEISRL